MFAVKMPFPEYQRIDACNKSSLSEMTRSPWHYKYALEQSKAPKASQVKGKLAHTLILEPELFESLYYVMPKQEVRRGSHAWEAQAEQAGARETLKPAEYALGQAIAEAVAAHPRAAECLAACEHREATIVWRDPATGLACKARPDALSITNKVIIDVKTTQNASESAFAKDVVTYKYHWQAAMYLDAAKAEFGSDFLFVFIAVENVAPHGVAVYLLSEEFIEAGRRGYQWALQRVAECRKSGVWPCYAEEAMELPAPAWLTKSLS